MNVLITGDSHTAVLQRGKKQLELTDEWPSQLEVVIRPFGNGRFLRTPFFVDKGDYAEIVEPTYRRQFKRFPPHEGGEESAIYGICAPFHSTHVVRNRDWSKFAPADIAVNEVPVSRAMMRQVVINDQKYVLSLIDLVCRLGRKVFVMESPRLFRHLDRFSTSRPEVLLRVDGIYREIVREELAKCEVPVVAVPVECLDDDGFMRDEFRHEKVGDQTHGNVSFGEIMVREMLRFIEKQSECATTRQVCSIDPLCRSVPR